MWPRRKSAVGKIGILHPEITGWMGGLRHIRTLTYALANACESAATDLHVLCEENAVASQIPKFPGKVIPIADSVLFPGEGRLRQMLRLPERSGLLKTAREHGISVLLPVRTVPCRASDIKTICWIPDFQHVYMPEFFPETQRHGRHKLFSQMAERCALVLLSSRNVLEHFVDAFPQ